MSSVRKKALRGMSVRSFSKWRHIVTFSSNKNRQGGTLGALFLYTIIFFSFCYIEFQLLSIVHHILY